MLELLSKISFSGPVPTHAAIMIEKIEFSIFW